MRPGCGRATCIGCSALRRAPGLRHRVDGHRRGQYTFAIRGERAYSVFKFEGGTHRVQRVPETESQGRVQHLHRHRRRAARSRGGRCRGRSESTCRSTSTAHPGPADSPSTRPTPPCASRTSPRASSSRCRTRSPSCKTARRPCAYCARGCTSGPWPQQAELAADRRSQVGTGDRAEKIRTYNYGERRVTDHRIKLTVHNLDQILEGQLDELTAALQADERARRLQAQAAAT